MCRLLGGEALKAFKPQTSWLSLITSGSKYAVATKGWFCLEVWCLLHVCFQPFGLRTQLI